MEKSKEYIEGWKANFEGKDLDSNPYEDESKESNKWAEGWIDADDNNRSHEQD